SDRGVKSIGCGDTRRLILALRRTKSLSTTVAFGSARRHFSLRAAPASVSKLLRCLSKFRPLPSDPSPRSCEPSERPQRPPSRHGPQAAVGHSYEFRSLPSSCVVLLSSATTSYAYQLR